MDGKGGPRDVSLSFVPCQNFKKKSTSSLCSQPTNPTSLLLPPHLVGGTWTHINIKNILKKEDSSSMEYHHRHHLDQPMTRHPCVTCHSSVANRLAALWWNRASSEVGNRGLCCSTRHGGWSCSTTPGSAEQDVTSVNNLRHFTSGCTEEVLQWWRKKKYI